MDDILTLITTKNELDDYGVMREQLKEKTVYCQVNSVTRSEFFGGGRNGLNPEFKFTMFAADYCDEAICTFHGKSYAIYRTYRVPDSDTIELYAERQGGINGKV